MTDNETFVCYSCKAKFQSIPGPETSCPICGSAYVEWKEYAKFSKKIRRKKKSA